MPRTQTLDHGESTGSEIPLTPLQKLRFRKRISPYSPTPGKSSDSSPKEKTKRAANVSPDIVNPAGTISLHLKPFELLRAYKNCN